MAKIPLRSRLIVPIAVAKALVLKEELEPSAKPTIHDPNSYKHIRHRSQPKLRRLSRGRRRHK